jgi:hypothetical protein
MKPGNKAIAGRCILEPNALDMRIYWRQGFELGRSIFKRADWWKHNQEFVPAVLFGYVENMGWC